MEELGLIQPTKVTQAKCPGLELFTCAPVGNPLLGGGDDAPVRLKRLIGMRLDELRRKSHLIRIDGVAFAPLVDGELSQHELEVGDTLRAVAIAIGDEIWSSGAQNPMLSTHIFQEYWKKLEACKFRCAELLTPLFITQEEMLFADMQEGGAENLEMIIPIMRQTEIERIDNISSGTVQMMRRVAEKIPDRYEDEWNARTMVAVEDEGIEWSAQAARKENAGQIELAVQDENSRITNAAAHAARMQKAVINADMLELRLLSIREMLRHYFKECPENYVKALTAALGIVSDSDPEPEFLEQRIGFEVARVGAWALSLRVLEEVKKEINAKGHKRGEHGDGSHDAWRMGLKIGRKGKRPWAYYAAGKGARQGEEELFLQKGGALFCPRWNGNSWGVSIGMIASFLAKNT